MLQPIIFDPTHPLVIRPVEPQGLALETLEGLVIFRCAAPYDQMSFRLTPGPGKTVALTVNWVEPH
jgi:hypothetical protein